MDGFLSAWRQLTYSGFVDFRDYCGHFPTSFCGGSIRSLIQPPQKESKSGSKEPENRLKPNPLTVSKLSPYRLYSGEPFKCLKQINTIGTKAISSMMSNFTKRMQVNSKIS